MTDWPQIAITGDSTILPAGAEALLKNVEPMLHYAGPVDPVSGNVSRFAVDGAMAPWPGVQDGVVLTGGVRGLTSKFHHIDNKPARANGVIYNGSIFDPLVVDLELQAHANSPEGISKVWSEWEAAWDPRVLGKFEHITQDRGYWYIPARLNTPWPDQHKISPRITLQRSITHSMRCDLGFWFGMPHCDTFQSSSGSGFLRLMNIGQEVGWPTLTFYGPGTLSFANGPGSSTMISFGPLAAGQVALINTYPPLRGVVDVTSTPQTQHLNGVQSLIQILTNLLTNGNLPPLAKWFESVFGIQPQQQPLYSLLNGRYTNPIPGVPQPSWAKMSYLPVSISGGGAGTKVIGRIDPMRRSPE